jgi:hypothetical protein
MVATTSTQYIYIVENSTVLQNYMNATSQSKNGHSNEEIAMVTGIVVSGDNGGGPAVSSGENNSGSVSTSSVAQGGSMSVGAVYYKHLHVTTSAVRLL